MGKRYTQHIGKVIEATNQFKHVMAITLDPSANYRQGVVRCITSREGDVTVKGYVDRSELHILRGNSLEHFEIGERLIIQGEEELIARLTPPAYEFIGLEDPDIWIDEQTSLTHLYFTIPIKPRGKNLDKSKKIQIHLGHAIGKDLFSLVMTEPVLLDAYHQSAKELSIAPLNAQGFRYNLIESRDRKEKTTFSIIQTAITRDMSGSWEYGAIAFHPATDGFPWIGGHASPGPLFPKSFIDVGEHRLLGAINGREANQEENGATKYGMFSVGLFIYDYELGKIDWVSPEPLIQDSEAITITFASQFVETSPGEGILYCHVDDSFVRAYTLRAEDLNLLLSK